MEVVVAPTPAAEFDFSSACTTPYASAPSSPRGFGGYYTSAPSSPTSAASIYNRFRAGAGTGAGAVAPWEEEEEEKEEFAFDFGGQMDVGFGEIVTATADELFEAGRIRPLKPLPSLQTGQFDYSGSIGTEKEEEEEEEEEPTRGRSRTNFPANDTGRRSGRAARSLSPARHASPSLSSHITTTTATIGGTTPKNGSKKWRLKDFFLFRSASEGRVIGNRAKDPLRKYTAAVGDVKNSSFRSTDSGASVGRSSRRSSVAAAAGGGGGSLHEYHYTTNRAVAEEMRRRTFLPYRQGLLGCLGFSPSVNGFGKAFGAFAGSHRR